MRSSIHLLIVLAAGVTCCVNPRGQALDALYLQLPDKKLWFAMRSVGAFNELRCRGFSARQAKDIYASRFASAERAIDAAMVAKYGHLAEGEGDIIPVGKQCSAYRGAIRRSGVIRAELQRRLGLNR